MANPSAQMAPSSMEVVDLKAALVDLGFDVTQDDDKGLVFLYTGRKPIKVPLRQGSSSISSEVGRAAIDAALKIVDEEFPSLKINQL